VPPKVIGPYRVVETLGSGGAGTVYRAEDRRSGDLVALKLLSRNSSMDARAARRLAREFETLADLEHPNVVRVFEVGVHQSQPYLTMELIEGLTLRQYLSLEGNALHTGGSSGSHPAARSLGDSDSWDSGDLSSDGEIGPFDLSAFAEESPSEEYISSDVSGSDAVRKLASFWEGHKPAEVSPAALSSASRLSAAVKAALNRPERIGRLKDAMLQLCGALGYIHGRGLVHRDLKPSNVMVDEDRQVRLMDFGLAKFLADDQGITQDGKLVGTFRYMPPEQILGEPLDARADLYSLGVILYELLCGRAPFDAPTPYELWQKVLETDATPIFSINEDTDAHLARVAHRLIRKEPDDRYQTAEEVYEALAE
jgi:serine/threonine protein kinase